ncbi:Protein of unknown function DUF1421 [Macleaya cordata]|uniref:DUF1421 domain-containing protein n=1 Tax=Macleaya cordata TaxID=56857 RepID=A0A200QBC3_MACCD|nr:Protein of unknown function DUF1421 [Macleaya cordata]
MASGSSGRTGSGSKGFDFGSDDILCSYDDMVNQDGTNGKHSDPVTGPNSKGYRERMGKFTEVHTQREESVNQDLIATVERTMKKYADNLLRFLEGISARLQQLELYCYNLEKSIEEMRSDLTRENIEADSKLRSLEKHLQEVHRSVQILRDKQELAETQKELAKLHLVQKESSQPKEDGVAPSASDAKKPDNTQEVQSQQLALALPHQINPSISHTSRSMEQQHQPMMPSSQAPPQNVHIQTQQRPYYQQNQLPTMPPQAQAQHHPQDHYLQVAQQQPQPPQSHVTQPQQVQQFPPQWAQQVPQQVQQQPQQPTAQPQMGPQTTPVYPPYQSAQPVNPSTQTINPSPETFSGSMPLQVQFSGVPQPGMSRLEPAGYGYAAPTTTRTTVQQQPPPQNIPRQPPAQPLQNTYGAPLSDGAYPVSGPHPTQPPRQGYMMYEGEGGRVPHPMPPHFSQGGYPPSHVSSLQNQQPIRHSSPSPVMRSHPYNELIEKVVSMGYGREFVISVIHRMDESGQPVDFNSVLDRLNVHSSGGSQRGWSG